MIPFWIASNLLEYLETTPVHVQEHFYQRLKGSSVYTTMTLKSISSAFLWDDFVYTDKEGKDWSWQVLHDEAMEYITNSTTAATTVSVYIPTKLKELQSGKPFGARRTL